MLDNKLKERIRSGFMETIKWDKKVVSSIYIPIYRIILISKKPENSLPVERD